jgi:hypothetical protein
MTSRTTYEKEHHMMTLKRLLRLISNGVLVKPVLAFAFLTTLPAWCGLVTYSDAIPVNFRACESINGNPYVCNQLPNDTITPAPAQVIATINGWNAVVGTLISTTATYGALDVVAAPDDLDNPQPVPANGNFFASLGWVDVHATASFSDMLTIYGGTGTGMVDVSVADSCFSGPTSYCTFTGTLAGTTMSDGDNIVNFTFGQPFSIAASITAFGETEEGGGNNDNGNGNIFIRHVTISGNGNYSYQSASGAGYPFTDATQIPEPGTWLAGLALGLLVVSCRERFA